MRAHTTILFAITLLLLSSCNSKTAASLTSNSQDKNVAVTVTGSRSSGVDPWKVVIGVKAYSFQKGKLELEVYADDLTDQTVKFDWQDNNHCLMTFQVRDDKPRQFQLIATADRVQLGEVGNNVQ